MLRKTFFLASDVGIRKVLVFCVVLGFVFTSDAVMSYWVPGFLQKTLGSATIMGLVMAFSSVVGLVVDFLFPSVMRNVGTKILIAALLLSTLLFQGSMYFSTYVPWIFIMLFGMAIWGIYYELMAFANQQFVSQTVNSTQRAMAWGLIGVFRSLAYLIGPLLASLLEPYGDRSVLMVAIGLSIVSLVLSMFMRLKHEKLEIAHHDINIMAEFGHWRVLLRHVWPVIMLSVTMGMVDAVFWTTGTVWGDKLAERSVWGSFFLTAYMLPGLAVGLIVARLGIVEHKKKIAALMLALGNIVLAGLVISDAVWWQISIVFVSSLLGSFAFPLVEATYTDIISRMGRERKHLMGLSSSTFSLAYILGPIFSGIVSDRVGELSTFAFFGVGAACVCMFVFFVTPRKLKLPQQEISKW